MTVVPEPPSNTPPRRKKAKKQVLYGASQMGSALLSSAVLYMTLMCGHIRWLPALWVPACGIPLGLVLWTVHRQRERELTGWAGLVLLALPAAQLFLLLLLLPRPGITIPACLAVILLAEIFAQEV